MAIKSNSVATRAQLPARPSSIKNTYLLTYNLVSTLLWLGVLLRTIRIAGPDPAAVLEHGSVDVYSKNEEFVRLTQSLAGLEVVHSLFGMFYRFKHRF